MPNLKPTTKTIFLRLPQHMLDSIKLAANARDVPYQSLIKVWLQEKLNSD
jgi:predicted DNA binding CopG/RHH family protein